LSSRARPLKSSSNCNIKRPSSCASSCMVLLHPAGQHARHDPILCAGDHPQPAAFGLAKQATFAASQLIARGDLPCLTNGHSAALAPLLVILTHFGAPACHPTAGWGRHFVKERLGTIVVARPHRLVHV